MTILAKDLSVRRQIWASLSELYLDTETTGSLPGIARTLAESDYSLSELRAILFDEVDPVLRANMRLPAGVWDGFDQEWLAGRILQRMERPAWGRLTTWFRSRTATSVWRELAPLVERQRADASLIDTDKRAARS